MDNIKKIIKYAAGLLARNTPVKFKRFGYPNKLLKSAPWLQPNYKKPYPEYVHSVQHLPDRTVRIIKPPRYIIETDRNPWEKYKEWNPRNRYVVTLSSARVCQNTVISPDNAILWDFSFIWNLDPQSHPLLKYPILPPEKNLTGRSLYLCVASYDNYFHWMFDLLLKLKVIHDAGHDFSDYDYYLVNSQKYEYQRKSLMILGIPEHKIIETSSSRNLILESVTIPSLADQSGLFEADDVLWLRDKLMSSVSDIKSNSLDFCKSRIFINRKKTLGRNIINYSDLVQVLEKHRFNIIELEGLELDRQIHIFNNAEVVIAPHGAGLTNLLFCRPRTKVIELVNPEYAHQMYYYLSMVLDLNYYYIIGDPITLNSSIHQDIEINVSALDRKLSEWFK